MLRRIAAALALVTVLSPVVGRANEWEEDYSGDDWRDESPPPDDYRVSVDMDVSGGVTLDTFQSPLQPYGDWVVVGGYGRVWRPHVAAGWRPYYYGRWEWTNEGWLWVSDEPWGWAAYHYGRWAYEPYQGWLWVPGYQWAPAWVSWRYSGDVVGWAPLAPGVSVYISTTPYLDAWWTFVPCDGFVGRPVHSVAYAPRYTRRYFDASVPAPARPGMRSTPGRPVVSPAWGGPPPRAIEQRIGRPVVPVRVVAAPSPGVSRAGSGEVSIFRPEVRGNGSGGRWPGRPSAPPSLSAESRMTSPGPAAPPRPDQRPAPRAWGGQAAPGGAVRERPVLPPGGGAAPATPPGGRGGLFGRPQQVEPAAPSGRAEPSGRGEPSRGGEVIRGGEAQPRGAPAAPAQQHGRGEPERGERPR